MKPRLVLASGSPQRMRLLRELGRPFTVMPSGADEDSSDARISRLVVTLARRKARSVAERLSGDALVLGADTVVFSGGSLIGKPKDEADSRRILERLNGRWQSVYTGVAVVRRRDGKVFSGYALSRCKAIALPPERLARLAGKHLDKAGSYAVQDDADPFIERVVGPLDNVIGLPLGLTERLLRRAERRGR